MLGVSITTLRRWEAEGKLIPEHTTGGHRYDLAKLKPELFRAAPDARCTVAYAHVSSHDSEGRIGTAEADFGALLRAVGLDL